MVAQVVLNNKEQNIDKIFDYKIPERLESLVSVGMRVLVPFGFGNRSVDGIVVDVLDKSDYENLKEIKSVYGKEPVCQPWILDLCLWISKKYFLLPLSGIKTGYPAGNVLRCA